MAITCIEEIYYWEIDSSMQYEYILTHMLLQMSDHIAKTFHLTDLSTTKKYSKN